MAQRTTKPAPADGAVLRLVGGAPRSPGEVRIEGTSYPMTDPEHFSLREQGAYTAAQTRVLQLEALALRGKSTKADDVEYRRRLIEMAKVIAPAVPGETWATFGTGALGDLVKAFFGLAATSSPLLRMAAEIAARQRTGTTSSPSSRGSTRSRRSAAATG